MTGPMRGDRGNMMSGGVSAEPPSYCTIEIEFKQPELFVGDVTFVAKKVTLIVEKERLKAELMKAQTYKDNIARLRVRC